MDGLTEDQIAELERKWKGDNKDSSGETEGEYSRYQDEEPEELDFG